LRVGAIAAEGIHLRAHSWEPARSCGMSWWSPAGGEPRDQRSPWGPPRNAWKRAHEDPVNVEDEVVRRIGRADERPWSAAGLVQRREISGQPEVGDSLA